MNLFSTQVRPQGRFWGQIFGGRCRVGCDIGRGDPSQLTRVCRSSWAPQWRMSHRQLIGDLGKRCELPQRDLGLETHFGIFWRPQNALFGTCSWCFEFAKQCFMSHLGARPRFVGSCPLPRHRTTSIKWWTSKFTQTGACILSSVFVYTACQLQPYKLKRLI